MKTKHLKPGDWIEVYKTYKNSEGITVSDWRKATFIRMVGIKVVAKTGIKDPSAIYGRWRITKKEKTDG